MPFPRSRERHQIRHKPVRVFCISPGVCGFLALGETRGETGFTVARPAVSRVFGVATLRLAGRDSSTFGLGKWGTSRGTWTAAEGEAEPNMKSSPSAALRPPIKIWLGELEEFMAGGVPF